MENIIKGGILHINLGRIYETDTPDTLNNEKVKEILRNIALKNINNLHYIPKAVTVTFIDNDEEMIFTMNANISCYSYPEVDISAKGTGRIFELVYAASVNNQGIITEETLTFTLKVE